MSQLRILLVDDNPDDLALAQRALRPMSLVWDVVTAGSAAEALDLLDTQAVDVVVSDIDLPGMDGLSLLGIVAGKLPGVSRVTISGAVAMSERPPSPWEQARMAKPCSAAATLRIGKRSAAPRVLDALRPAREP